MTHPIPGLTHHTASIEGARLHYVAAGDTGSPVLLVHGFPESWWAFHRLIPLLAAHHSVFAVDLPGFGESDVAPRGEGPVGASAATAAALHAFIEHLDVGPVHLSAQDIAGGAAFRLVAEHPDDVSSFTGIEMGLAGFGLETLADVTRGGSWHIGALAAPGIPELVLAGREREFVGWMIRAMTARPESVTDADIDEFARAFARPGGWNGAAALYRSMLAEGGELRDLAQTHPLEVPVLAVGAGGGAFTASTLESVAADTIATAQLDGVGHYAALEAPDALAQVLRGFWGDVDGR